MARIRQDLVGSVLVAHPGTSDPIALIAGDEVPDGIFVGEHVLEPGSASEPAIPSTSDTNIDPAALAAKAEKKAAKQAAKDAAKQAAEKTAAADASSTADLTADSNKSSAGDAQLTPPPLQGSGSNTEAWRTYAVKATAAKGLEIEIPADAKRSDIVEALNTAGVRTV